ncbi:MAG: aspartyl protease family protein [Pyrinomonadaceae bacterium]
MKISDEGVLRMMKANTFLNFHFPCRNGNAVCFLGICLSLTFFCLTAAASANAQQDAPDSRRLIKQAEKLSRKGNYTEAETLLRGAVEQNPNNSKLKLSLSYVLLKERKFLEVYDISIAVAKAEPKNARALALVGMALLNIGNFDAAKKIFQTAYFLDNEESLAWFGSGMLDFYENRIFQSLPKLERACFLDSDEPDFVFSSAQVLARAEKYTEAAEAYDKFLQIAPISDADRRARIKGLISFLRYVGDRQKLYSIDDNLDQVSVPIDLYNVRPIIEIGIGDRKEKFRFVLDTGSGISVISNKTAQALKIKPVARGGTARAIGGTGKFEIVYGFLKSINIGEAKIKNVPVYIREFNPDNENVDGYIGLSLISKFLTTVDYGNLTFTLRKKDRAAMQDFESEALSLPLRLTSSGFLSGEVQIEGVEVPLNFIVDTGASVSVISDELANTNEISRFLTPEKMRVFGAAGVTENVSSFLLPSVSFGKHTREKIKAVSLNLDVINETSGFEQAGIIGGNFLKNYRVTFDFQHSQVTFVPVVK